MKRVIILICSALLIACTENSKNKTSENEKNKSPDTSDAGYMINNYAITWKWKSKDVKLINENIVEQTKQLTNHWHGGIVENVYFEQQPKTDGFENYPGISFFIKASSEAKAKKILDEMIFVKLGISEYAIYPVGTKWLGRNEDVINERKITKSWVSVWSTSVDHNSKMSMAEVSDNAKMQSDLVLKLYNEGLVENVYFDIAGTQKRNDVTDFVMFVNANTESEAREILDNLPFSKKNIAHYQLFSVGVHWMGEYK